MAAAVATLPTCKGHHHRRRPERRAVIVLAAGHRHRRRHRGRRQQQPRSAAQPHHPLRNKNGVFKNNFGVWPQATVPVSSFGGFVAPKLVLAGPGRLPGFFPATFAPQAAGRFHLPNSPSPCLDLVHHRRAPPSAQPPTPNTPNFSFVMRNIRTDPQLLALYSRRGC